MVKDYFKSIGLDISFLIIGLIAAFITMKENEHREKTRLEKFCVFISGLAFAVLVTPLVIWISELFLSKPMPQASRLGTCFLCTKFGEQVIKMVLSTDWKGVWELIKGLKFPTLKK